MMSYKDMRAKIQGGESVMIAGRIITRLEDLPQPEDLATTEEDKEIVAADIRAEIDERFARLAKIEGGEGAKPLTLSQLQTRFEVMEGQLLSAAVPHQEILALTQERDGLQSRVTELESGLKTAQGDRDSADKERDKLTAENKKLKAELSETKKAASGGGDGN